MSTQYPVITLLTSYDPDLDRLTLLGQDATSGTFMEVPSTVEEVPTPLYSSSATYKARNFTATLAADADDAFVLAFQHSTAGAGEEPRPPQFSIWAYAVVEIEDDEIVDVALSKSDSQRYFSESHEVGKTIHFKVKRGDGTSSPLGYTIKLKKETEKSPPPVLRPPDGPIDSSGGENPLATPGITSVHEPWADPAADSTMSDESPPPPAFRPVERDININITINIDGQATVHST